MTTALTVREELTPDVWQMLLSVATASKQARTLGVITAEEAAIKLLFCWEHGLPLTTANNGLFVVNGKLAVQSNIMAAALRRHPDYDYEVIEVGDKGATVAIIRRGTEVGRASFTEEDAKRAGLLSKDNWKTYPQDMYFSRALARAQRRYAPDVFMQPVYTPEEVSGDVVDATSWTYVTPAKRPEPTAADVLSDLVDLYGAEAVMKANGGAIPETLEDARQLAALLEA